MSTGKLTFKQVPKGEIVAIWRPEAEKSKNAMVFLDPNLDSKHEQDLDKEDLREILALEHGKRATRFDCNLKLLECNLSKLPAPQGEKGVFLPLWPQTKEKERIIHYICGKSGSGKTYLARQLAKLYAKMKLQVVIISPVTDHKIEGLSLPIDELVEFKTKGGDIELQKSYERAKIRYKHRKAGLDPDERAEMEMLLLELKPVKKKKRDIFELTPKFKKLTEKPTLFVFDDNEAAEDKQKTEFLQNTLLLTGRHMNAYMIVINHLANNGQTTRNVINEAHTYTFFQPYNQTTAYFLKKYMQFTIKQRNMVKQVLKTSRYCTIYKLQNILLGQNVMYVV